jgi:predicted RNA-binding Zn-ribbon protein involved in translation (DUF1610 family)
MTTKHYWDRLILDEQNAPIKYERNKGKYEHDHSDYRKHKETGRVIYDTQDFKCRNCGFFVTASRELSGVNNRNHCPRCLWSRHMDITPGDRRSDCLSRMEPIGLSVKHVTKKYGSTAGELMVIHHCTGCGKISINRIAADDDAMVIQRIFTDSLSLPLEQRELLEDENVHLLQSDESEIVNSQLFGLPILS